jgi:cytochrome P450
MTSAPEIDPSSPAMLGNPYPVYAELQEKHPVFWHEKVGAWIVTRYEDCRDILMDSERFVRDPRRVSQPSSEESASVATLGAERQSDLRRLLIGSMHSQDTEQLGRNVRVKIDQILAGVASRPSFDWIPEVAAPLAGSITAELLGVREPDPRIFRAIAEGMALKFDEDLGEYDAEAERRIQEAVVAFGAVIDEWLGSEDTHGTILTLKNRADELGVPLPVIKNSIGLLFSGGYTTIFGSSGNLAYTVMERPDVLEQFRDPSLLSTGIDEFLRLHGPTWATGRVATRTTEIRGVTVKQGDPMLIVVAAANRDPAQFPRPQEIVLDRTPNKHLAFGWGPHSCVGSLFGQLALRELIGALHDAPTPLRMTGTPVPLPTITVRSFGSLPVTFTA